jgi:hypothetical protein
MIRFSHKQFELASEGVHHAKLIEIRDIEPAVNPMGKEKERVRFIWELRDEMNSAGAPMRVFQTLNLSLHPQSFLSKAIFDITGREPGMQFDLDTLVGAEADLVIKHNQGADERTYANVVSILRLKTAAEEAEEKRVRAATQRVKDESRRSHTVTRPQPEQAEIADNDVPF